MRDSNLSIGSIDNLDVDAHYASEWQSAEKNNFGSQLRLRPFLDRGQNNLLRIPFACVLGSPYIRDDSFRTFL